MALDLPPSPRSGEKADVLRVMDFTDELGVEAVGSDRLVRPLLVKCPVNMLCSARGLPRGHDRCAVELKAVVTPVGLGANNDHDGILAKRSAKSHPSTVRRAYRASYDP
jgi:hypothetical protein